MSQNCPFFKSRPNVFQTTPSSLPLPSNFRVSCRGWKALVLRTKALEVKTTPTVDLRGAIDKLLRSINEQKAVWYILYLTKTVSFVLHTQLYALNDVASLTLSISATRKQTRKPNQGDNLNNLQQLNCLAQVIISNTHGYCTVRTYCCLWTQRR